MIPDRNPSSGGPGAAGADSTAVHFRQAATGRRDSLAWIVERFDPCVYAAARHRLGAALKRHVDAEDLVAEVWAVALRRLSAGGDPLDTPAFLAFLATTLRNVLNNLLRKHLRAPGAARQEALPLTNATGSTDPFDRLPADITGVTTRARLSELRERLWLVLEDLDPKDRDVLVLRGIEQVANRDAAIVLGIEPGTVAVRYHRAVEKVRHLLPNWVFADLSAD